jgi:hypothetical protein
MVLDTPDQINAFRLLTLRSMLRLEAAGMKRRGPSALAIVKAETGLKARTAAAMIPLYSAWLVEQGILEPRN